MNVTEVLHNSLNLLVFNLFDVTNKLSFLHAIIIYLFLLQLTPTCLLNVATRVNWNLWDPSISMVNDDVAIYFSRNK